jgi:CRAL/TRIO domain.
MQCNVSLQDAFPGIVVANHMVNANPVTEAFMNMSKPFLKKELASKVCVMRKAQKGTS